MEITAEQRAKVKGQGFLSNKGGQLFSGRIITENGVISAQQMTQISQAAVKYGNGDIAFTSRLTIEVQGIPFENIEPFKAYLAEVDLVTGGTGAKVRPVVACKGTVCSLGLIDTFGLGTQIHKLFYEGYGDVVLPHKFKIAVGGCPNNCVKPDLNDLGIVGQRVPKYDESTCKGCAKCGVMDVCPMKAVTRDRDKIVLDRSLCNNCGMCVSKCPFHSVSGEVATYKVYIGGRWGKFIRHSNELPALFTREEVINLTESAILFFKENGLTGERFGSMIDRIGVAEVEKSLISNASLHNKDEILGLNTTGGASC